MGALILIKPVFIVLYKRETVTGFLELPSVSWEQNGGHSKLFKASKYGLRREFVHF